MITWKEIDNAIGAVVASALHHASFPAVRIRPDISEPIARRSYRIDLSNSDDMGTENYADRGMDVEIYYYPEEKERPRDELNEVSQILKAALRTGICAAGIVIEIDDTIDADASEGVRALMFRLRWIETAAEDGEFMENLVYEKEELVHGSDDA